MPFGKIHRFRAANLSLLPLTMDASIIEDLGADSLDVVDLIMSLEEEFDCEIPDEEVDNIKTVGDIVKYIEAHI